MSAARIAQDVRGLTPGPTTPWSLGRQLAGRAPTPLRYSSSPLLLRLELIQRRRIGLVSRQCRRLGTTRKIESNNNRDPKNGSRPPPPRPPSFSRFVFRAIFAGFKDVGKAMRGASLKGLYKQNPGELVLALVLLAGCAGIIVYVVYAYFTYFYSEQFTRYPDPVAKALRRALYYSNYNPDPKLALKNYRKAIELCDELNVDPFTDEVMGIKIQLAAWLERIDNHANAIKILENLRGDCLRWVELMERHVKEGTIAQALNLMPPSNLKERPKAETSSPAQDGKPVQVPEEVMESLWGKRTRILGKAVGISVKLAELYSDEHVLKKDKAHDRLVWAVETALAELRRRTTEGLKQGEGEWMTSEQIGGALESLGHSYETRSQFELALPLFLQALRLSHNPCHSAVLMNNIAICFAQHPVMGPSAAALDNSIAVEKPVSSATPAERRASYLDSARRWATNANRHASEPQGEERTAECDEACAVSLCNLGDFASLGGNSAEARRMFEQAITLSKRVGFEPGVAQAEAGLKMVPKSDS
ncbi:hypothetical protein B0H66DRAFT_124460 [Apodospora peruviana]|uniref:Uncharacterized protein n=1 Tax=Apodospora peruviana TaxID=516989 RepID=A0AAE0IIN5_9PEZI|nr:hypothetical protein B0H66DRAFT_124460 [Apodospora peruviana]